MRRGDVFFFLFLACHDFDQKPDKYFVVTPPQQNFDFQGHPICKATEHYWVMQPLAVIHVLSHAALWDIDSLYMICNAPVCFAYLKIH